MTIGTVSKGSKQLPRPEYPRPDWQRDEWLNLNGEWAFRFDPEDLGRTKRWFGEAASSFEAAIAVPFSWASPLSGIGSDEKGIGWYRRDVEWEPANEKDRLFLRFGAVDYTCDVWINEIHIGTHSGGYGAFEFDVTDAWKANAANRIVVRAEDFDHDYQARGKQGYGEIRGIWQPVWLEARPQSYLLGAKFTTRMDGRIDVAATIVSHQAGASTLSFAFAEGAVRHRVELELAEGENEVRTSFTVAEPLLWSPETPHLYFGELRLDGAGGCDLVHTYFGIREIGTALFGDRGYRWITLNGKPVYLNGTLDQSYHPTGYFTYPSDEEMQDEISLMKRLGLNFVRIHIKPEEPRKLYWADKLGILVMEDMPCFWGNPDEGARAAYEREAKEIIDRDFNHPSIFSWVMFNETWGLKTNSQASSLTSDQLHPNHYLPGTQEWVRTIYRWAKGLDPTRIVEDNSPCNWDHVETDINTWHFYINGYEEVRKHVAEVVEKTFPGSAFNYIGGNAQSDAPLMNSECGNVWGIDGGAGDSDLAWHYRYMLNEFRRHDKMCGFVFTEFRDVVNEFNGYYRLDGQDKKFGYEWFVPGMTIADLHSPDFIVIDAPPCATAEAGSTVSVPLLRSSFSDRYFGQRLSLAWELWYDNLGDRIVAAQGSVALDWNGYGVSPLAPLQVALPNQDAVAVLAIRLLAPNGETVTRNFTTFDVRSGAPHGTYDADGGIVGVPVAGFSEHSFPYQWNAIQGQKANGGASGRFVYDIELPGVDEQAAIGEIEIMFEAGAKRLLTRNTEGGEYKRPDLSFMHGAKSDTERNPNTYYMTDAERHESTVIVRIDGVPIETFVLPDDPADSRGVLSWHYQPESRKLDEAGSYGYLCKAVVPSAIALQLNRSRKFTLQLEAKDGGLALYGRNAGRYPIDIAVRYR
ncbi:glycoside hydrolase family 2 [Paenibacillus antri]|uniref:Glycoside hydrolase family 2 n=1 Tax=Paenibacillus antri TaxID=2582848 RepID=A0A5R9G622_9BACL|nr:sugar-binding domain-containing protein [Paenibacillus antri]TLS48958.1 glycoside hydrolase family 2 [Paenibacillus antri]